MLDRNRTPSSTGRSGPASSISGRVSLLQRLHGHAPSGGASTVTGTPGPGSSTFALSSNARLTITTGPATVGVHCSAQFVVPVAAVHVRPPSIETSTRATVPAASNAVPSITNGLPRRNRAAAVGNRIVDIGGVSSDTADETTRSAAGVAG